MIYLIGFKQDIVTSFVRHTTTVESAWLIPYRVLHLEDVVKIELDYTSFLCQKINTQSEEYILDRGDRIYLRPYSFERACEQGVMSESEDRVLRPLYRKLGLARQTLLGNTCLRSDSNCNKLLHASNFSNIIPSPSSRFRVWARENSVADQVIKSPSGFRTEVISQKDLLDESSSEVRFPYIQQKLIRGEAIRVHVVGFNEVFATSIQSDGAIDYRYSNSATYRELELPADIGAACRAVAEQYGLGLCGIDLLHDGKNYYFLEVNPEPGWAYMSRAQCQRIWESICRYLIEKDLKETIHPEELSPRVQQVGVVIESQTDALSYDSLPQRLIPEDYIAKLGQEHPLWN